MYLNNKIVGVEAVAKLEKIFHGNYRISELHRGKIFDFDDFSQANNFFKAISTEGRYFLKQKTAAGNWDYLLTKIVDNTGKTIYIGT
jgi:hypothetical protein